MEDELSALKQRLTYYKTIESEVVQPTGLGLKEYVNIVKSRLVDAENQSAMSRLEVLALRKQLEEAVKCPLEVSNVRSKEHLAVTRLDVDEAMAVVADTRDMMIDVDDLSIGAMNSSMSTTSGFDDDNSCASSVADLRLEEMPSEETWGFDEYDAACVGVDGGLAAEMRAAEHKDKKSLAKSDLARRQQPTVIGDQVPSESVRLSDEELWVSRFQKLEARLAQAMQNEQRARDQAALLGEEKDRRIAALQEQVDQLESNEFRLSETIRSLERIERTFSLHMQSSEARSHSASSHTAQDEATVIADVSSSTERASENQMQHEISAILKASLEKLRTTEIESDAVDKRIKTFGSSVDGVATIDGVNTVAKESNNGWTVPAEIVDFEAEYRELEVLMKELKRVLSVGNDSGKWMVSVGGNGDNVEAKNCTTDDMESALVVDASSNWEMGSACYSIPTSPMFEIYSPVGLTMDRSQEFEHIERCLTQQVCYIQPKHSLLFLFCC
jgi:hypothetical protein